MSMASGYTNLLDIAKANGSDQLAGLIDETTKATPEVREGYFRPVTGTSYKTFVRTSLPTAGFRNANQGTPATKSTYGERIVSCFIFNPRIEVDRMVADKYEFGATSWIAVEAGAIMEASVQTLGRAYFYGRNQWTPNSGGGSGITYGGDLLGFPGLIDQYDANDYNVSAGGTTNYTATSVWGVKWGPRNCSWVYGGNGQLQLSDVTLQRVTDSAGNPLTAYCQEVMAHPGLQLGDKRSVIRISDITNDANCTLTDKLLFDTVAKLPANMKPDMWFMNRSALAMLRDSRTTFNPEGRPAPIPDSDGQGIPIKVTDSISSFEPLEYFGNLNPNAANAT
jgi:hypothetical protein